MDVLAACAARLDRVTPYWADEIRWHHDASQAELRRLIDRLVRRGDVALDIGASRGQFSSRMLSRVGPRGAVHAFEPNPEHARRLAQLARRRPLTVHPVALSDQDANAWLHIPLLNGQRQSGLATMSAFHFEEYEPVLVDTRQLDGLLSTQTGITFMKCDVEGHEDAVLAGGIELLTRERPTVLIELEERHRDEPVETAFAFFGELGYSGWAVFPDGLRPLESFDIERDQRDHLAGGSQDGVMPSRYIHNFLFTPSDGPLGVLSGVL